MTLYAILTLVFAILTIATVALREGNDIEGMSVATMVCAVFFGAFFVISLVKGELTAGSGT